jgi:hypothetical protein
VVIVEPEVKLTGVAADILKSGEAEVANVKVAVALCLIPPDIPMIVTT